MNAFYDLLESRHKSSFKVDYPYYGLFGSAEVTRINVQDEDVFQCKLRNGKTIVLKKVNKKWLDTFQNEETPLSNIIGTSIEEHLKK